MRLKIPKLTGAFLGVAMQLGTAAADGQPVPVSSRPSPENNIISPERGQMDHTLREFRESMPFSFKWLEGKGSDANAGILDYAMELSHQAGAHLHGHKLHAAADEITSALKSYTAAISKGPQLPDLELDRAKDVIIPAMNKSFERLENIDTRYGLTMQNGIPLASGIMMREEMSNRIDDFKRAIDDLINDRNKYAPSAQQRTEAAPMAKPHGLV